MTSIDGVRSSGLGIRSWESRNRGSLLIITLWLVTILSVLAVAIARSLSLEVRLTKYRLARAQAKALAHSGVSLAMARLARDAQMPESDGTTHDWLGDDWAAPPGASEEDPTAWVVPLQPEDRGPSRFGGTLTIRISDEERRLSLNAVSEPVLTRLLALVTGSSGVARPILDYLDPDDELPVDEPPYYPKNAPVEVIEELRDIPGVGDIVAALEPFLTVETGQGQPPMLNINTATREALLAVAGDTLAERPAEAVVDALLASRPGADGAWGTEDDCVATEMNQAAQTLADCAQLDWRPFAELLSKAAFAVSSSTFRIQVEAVVGPPEVRHRIGALIRRSADSPAQLVAWREL